MNKRTYYRPLILPLEPGDDPGIVIGGSQDTSGWDPRWAFDGIDEDTMTMIELNCGDFDLQDMDTNGDYLVTLAEFTAWWDSFPDNDKPW